MTSRIRLSSGFALLIIDNEDIDHAQPGINRLLVVLLRHEKSVVLRHNHLLFLTHVIEFNIFAVWFRWRENAFAHSRLHVE